MYAIRSYYAFGLGAVLSGAGALAGIVFGGLYSTIVITGVHHSFRITSYNVCYTKLLRNDGEEVFTARIFPDKESKGVEFFSDGDIKLNVKKWDI